MKRRKTGTKIEFIEMFSGGVKAVEECISENFLNPLPQKNFPEWKQKIFIFALESAINGVFLDDLEVAAPLKKFADKNPIIQTLRESYGILLPAIETPEGKDNAWLIPKDEKNIELIGDSIDDSPE